MSSRPQFNPYPVIVNGDMSSNITSAVTIIQKLSMISYSLKWSGSSPVGTIAVQVSNDYSQNAEGGVSNAGTWNTLPFLSFSGSVVTSFDVSGNTGNGFVDIDQTGAYAIRIVYTAGSGTGSLQAVINAKVS